MAKPKKPKQYLSIDEFCNSAELQCYFSDTDELKDLVATIKSKSYTKKLSEIIKEYNDLLNNSRFIKNLYLNEKVKINICFVEFKNEIKLKVIFSGEKDQNFFEIPCNKEISDLIKILKSDEIMMQVDEAQEAHVVQAKTQQNEIKFQYLYETLLKQYEQKEKENEELKQRIIRMDEKIDTLVSLLSKDKNKEKEENKSTQENNMSSTGTTNNAYKRSETIIYGESSQQINNDTLNNAEVSDEIVEINENNESTAENGGLNLEWSEICKEGSTTSKATEIIIDTKNKYKVAQIMKTSDINGSQCKIFPMRNNQQRVMLENTVDIKKIENLLNTNNIEYHMFANNNNSHACYIIKNICHDYSIDEIKEELTIMGFRCTENIQVEDESPIKSVQYFNTRKQRIGNIESSMIKVVLNPNANTKEFEKIKFLFNTRVYIEKMKSGAVTQCKRCQAIGHTANFCRRPYRCVKCTDNHLPGECKVSINNGLAPQCVNCMGRHIASDINCPVIKKYLETTKRGQKQLTKFTEKKQEREIQPRPVINGLSYAGVVSNGNTRTLESKTTNKEEIIKKGFEMMKSMMQQMQQMFEVIQSND